jgi:flavorubredoxin
VIELAAGKLYQLPNPYELNGSVASHPAAARGFAPLNSYLLLEGDRAILIDTGFSVSEESLLRQLSSLIDASTPLEIFPTLIGEFGSICNAKPVTDHFNVVKYYGMIEGANEWMDFRPEHAPHGTEVGTGTMATVENAVARTVDSLDWAGGRRQLEIVRPPIQLLPDRWAYDSDTGTLFTADSFNHVWRETSDGPWTVSAGETAPTVNEVYDLLVGSRYWWLPGAATEELERGVADLFREYDVKIIAPRFGCTITEPAAITAHSELLRAALREAGEREAPEVPGARPMRSGA